MGEHERVGSVDNSHVHVQPPHSGLTTNSAVYYDSSASDWPNKDWESSFGWRLNVVDVLLRENVLKKKKYARLIC